MTPTPSCPDSRPRSCPQDTDRPCPGNSTYDFTLVTDGSGFLDHFGGFGAIAISGKYAQYFVSCGCSMHMETGRAEFSAIITGLRSILEGMSWDNKVGLKALAANRATILVISDREDLVGSINKVFTPTKNGDLWAQFEWYTRYFDVCALHVKRDTHATHKMADRLASEMRIVLMDYYNIQKECHYI